MKTNEHQYDRMIRIVVGIIITAFAFVGPRNPWFLLGLIPLVTGIVGWCPIYALFGLNSYKLGHHKT